MSALNIVCLAAFRATGRCMPPIDLVAPRLLPGDRVRCTATGRTGFILRLQGQERAQMVLDDGKGILVCPASLLERTFSQEKSA